jgi:hypothetical protein
MNGRLKAAWYAVKQALIDKKRAVGLRGEVEKVEIVVLISQAIQSSFADITYSKLAASATGWNPPTMKPLDDPDILQSAPDEVRDERAEIIVSRGGSVSTNGSNELILPSERNLLEEGSGLMAGADAVVEAASQLNFTGGTASQLFQLSTTVAKRDEGRRRHMEEKEAGGVPDLETLQKRYEELPRLTANGIVAHGSGECDYAAFMDCMRRQRARESKDAEAKKKKQEASTALQDAVRKVNKKLADNNNKESCLTVADLKTLCKFYKKKGDKPIPTKKEDLLVRYRQCKRRISGQEGTTASISTHSSRARGAAKEQTDSESDHESKSSDEDTSDEESQESSDGDESGDGDSDSEDYSDSE